MAVDLNGVAVFLAVAEAKSFTAAARHLVTVEGRGPLILRLVDGRLSCNDVQMPLPEQVQVLAKRLQARIFPSDS
jgi:hypothetical protein